MMPASDHTKIIEPALAAVASGPSPDATAGAVPPLNPAAPAVQVSHEPHDEAVAAEVAPTAPAASSLNARHEADIAGEVPRDTAPASLSPETATKSTVQRPTEAAHVASVAGGEIREVGGGTRAFPAVDTHPENAEAAPQAGDGSAPHVALSPASNPPATEAGGEPKAPPAAPVTDFVVFFDADADARCRKPDMCGSHSRLGVCDPCQQAWDAEHQREAAE